MKPETIPHDIEAEAGALACVVDTGDVALLEQLCEAHFHDIRHREIFHACLAVNSDVETINAVSVSQRLKDGNQTGSFHYLIGELLPNHVSSANWPEFLRVVLDRATRRGMLIEADEFKRRALDLRTPIEIATPETVLERLASRQFDAAKVIPEPEPRYSISGNGVSTAGNLTTITAGVKAGKTSFVLAMLSATMTTNTEADCLGVESSNPAGKAVLHFDTEQSLADHHAGIMRAARRAGLAIPPPWLRSYCVTGFSLRDLRAGLPAMLKHAKEQHGGIHSVVLDGVADYVADVNDPAECNAFIAELHAQAIAYDCPIIGVIHFNPGTEKSRGHLGSQIERKAETNLRLDRDGDCICVWSEKNRRAPITKNTGPRFQWSAEQSMFASVAAAGEVKAEARRAELIEIRDEAFRLAGKSSLHWKDMVTAIHGVPGVGSEKTAIRRLKDMGSMGLIEKNIIGQYEHPTPK